MDRVPSPNRESPRAAPPRESPVHEVRGLLRPLDDGRERLRTGNANTNPFEVPDIVAAFPDTDFNWKRYEVAGKPDYGEMRMYEEQGWRACPHAMFPGRFAPEGTQGPVIVKDMILMERPLRLTLEARREEMAAANRAVQVNRLKMAEAPDGQAPRMAPQVRETREAIEIPEE